MSKIHTPVYLFDWGDTLMVDFVDQSGKMCDWPNVAIVDGAAEVLAHLSKQSAIFVATGANDSTESEIKQAFDRVNLSQYIDGYFCQANLGVGKDSPYFFPYILEKLVIDKLAVSPADIIMVGDSLTRDILPALKARLNAILLSTSDSVIKDENVRVIRSLHQLIFKEKRASE